ncbi:dual OB domain-containing protein [Paenibacillus sp. Z3-2]
MDVKFILLTKSRKHGNYCIAGVDIDSRKWIRLVSSHYHHAVPEDELTYEDGSQAQIFDIIQVKLTKAVPQYFQPENYEYDSSYYWRKLGESSLEEAKELLEQHADTYIFHNSDSRLKDIFVSEFTPSQHYSLKLVCVTRAVLHVDRYEKLKYKLSFEYNGNDYIGLRITDDAFTQLYQNEGRFILNNIGLVISLGEVYDRDQNHYKLVATVIH